MKRLILFILALSFQFLYAQSVNQLKEFDAYIEKGRVDWSIPGLAVAVVKDGKTIFKKGYGVRKVGGKEKIDTQTIFACASTTKAMTAVCLGILVDEGKLTWNDAVSKHLPDFKLYDVYVTRELKIRDLLTHSSGVGNTDFLWGAMDISSDEILKKMELVKPSYSLRSSFIYQNIFYLVAGKVIQKVSGQSWDEFITARIFKPLNMNRTFPTKSLVKDENHSYPHYLQEGFAHAIDPDNADNVGPAGSVNSCIDDMSLWLQCMLDSAKYTGGQLLKPATWTELFKPQVMVPAAEFYPTMQLIKPNWTTYGLGWFQHDYQGKKINYHTGSLAGEIAMHAQLPDAKLAVYIFGNLDHAELRHALVYKTFDLFALGGKRDWSNDLHMFYNDLKLKAESSEKTFENQRVLNTKPSLDLASYTGTYADELYGTVEVKLVDGNLN
jgi:CubicO group peptidase (beta-lactamase class C family)